MNRTGVMVLLSAALGVSCATQHQTHRGHHHVHGLSGDAHVTVQHDDHVDYLHSGHLHHQHGDHYDEHRIEVTPTNPERCTPGHGAGEHSREHRHTESCGHAGVPHGGHTDYLVAGHLHHPHGDHCDDHGDITSPK